jgi:mxaK protein
MFGRDAFVGFWRRLRTALLWGLAGLSIVAVGVLGQKYIAACQANGIIADLKQQRDVAIDERTASGNVVLARVNELLRRDRFGEAQALANTAGPRLTPKLHAQTLYNLANSRIRQAIVLVEKGDLDSGTALVNVAKSEYRLALRLVPDDWDLKYNLDVAMRMVRDLPVGDSEAQDVPPDAPTRLWTDLPGIPKGLP